MNVVAVRTLVTCALALGGVTAAAAGWVAVTTSEQAARISETMATENVPSLRSMAELQLVLVEQRGLVGSHLLRPVPDLTARLEPLHARAVALIAAADRHAHAPREDELVERLRTAYLRVDGARRHVIELAGAGDADAAEAAHAALVPMWGDVTDHCSEILALNEALLDGARDRARAVTAGVHTTVTVAMVLMALGSLLVGALLFWSAIPRLVKTERFARVGQLAGTLAHELRGPLSAMRLQVERLGGSEPGSGRAADVVAELLAELDRMERMTASHLQLLRHPTPKVHPLPAGDLVERAVAIVRPTAHHKGVACEVDLPRDLPQVQTDRDLFGRALLNLLWNAIQATSAGGRVRVSGRRMRRRDRPDRVAFVVEDTGEGINAAQRRRLFEPLESSRPNGLGLGLYEARRAMTSMGGRVEMASTGPSGTTFVIEVPCADDGREPA